MADTTTTVDLDAVLTRWNTAFNGSTCDGEHIAALQASADDVPYLAAEVNRLRKLVGDESYDAAQWGTVSRAAAIRQANDRHTAWAQQFESAERLRNMLHATAEELQESHRERDGMQMSIERVLSWADRNLGENSPIHHNIAEELGRWHPDGTARPRAAANPPGRGPLWSAIDWTLWGHGVGDELREHAADLMVASLSPDLRKQLTDLFTWWKERRGALPHEQYAKLRAELEQIRADRQLLAAAHAILVDVASAGDDLLTVGLDCWAQARDVADRISDELGGPVAKAGLGPQLREQIAQLSHELAEVKHDRDHVTGERDKTETRLRQATADVDNLGRRLKLARAVADDAWRELTPSRPVVSAACAWRSRVRADPRLWADEHDQALIAAVDALTPADVAHLPAAHLPAIPTPEADHV